MTVDIHAVLMLACTIALGVGGWFFRELNGTVKALSAELAQLRIDLAVLRTGQERLADHEVRIRALEQRSSADA